MRRLALGFVVVGVTAAGVALLTQRPSAAPKQERSSAPEVATSPAPAAISVWARERDELTARAEAAEARARRTASWMDSEAVAGLQVDLARLTGDYGHYVRAEKALEEAFKVAPPNAGPFAARAGLNLSLDRLSRVEADLVALENAAVQFPKDRDRNALLRADLAFQSGRYEDAEAAYDALLARQRNLRHLVASAQVRWKTGRLDEAAALLEEAAGAAKGTAASTRAWVALVRGLFELDRNRLDAALAHYREGLEILPGYWLLEEHVAEILTLQGRTDEALAIYTDVVDRTGNPELMDQVALIHRARGDQAKFEGWKERAQVAHERRLAQLPEAASGHAIDHYLEVTERLDRALELAELDHAHRPGGEAKEKLIEIYLSLGRVDAARSVLEDLEQSSWRTANSLALASAVHALTGDETSAKSAAASANQLVADSSDKAAELVERARRAAPDAKVAAP